LRIYGQLEQFSGLVSYVQSLFVWIYYLTELRDLEINHPSRFRRLKMKNWTTPEVSTTETGMEVTSYMPAELDRA